jgi:hypothetical protein
MKNVKKIVASIVTLALVGSLMTAVPANAEKQETYTASLEGTIGSVEFWDAEAPTTTITGDGQYSITLEVSEPTTAVDEKGALILNTDINPYTFFEEGAEISTDNEQVAKDSGVNITVDSILVDGEEIAYNGPSAGAYVNDSNKLRVNIYNVWGNDVRDIDFDFTVESTVTVNFSITGLGGDPVVTDATSDTVASESESESESETSASTDETTGDTTTVASESESVAETTTTAEVGIGDSEGDPTIVSGSATETEATSVSEAEEKIDYSVYESIIDAAGKVVSDKGYDKLNNENGKLGYYLFDINGDGVKELIIAEDFTETLDGTTKLVSGYYDIYTIVDGEVVEIDQKDSNGEKLLAVASNGYLSISKDAEVAVLDGKLVYVRTLDGTDEVEVIYITGYEGYGTNLKLTYNIEKGTKSNFSQLNLFDYTDKSAITGAENPKASESGSGAGAGNNVVVDPADEGTTVTTADKTTNPVTGDAGIGTVAIAFAVAGVSAIALKKRD